MENNEISVRGKVILITGAFGLIGKEISRCFLDNHAYVILAGHNIEMVEEVKNKIADNFSQKQFIVTSLEITDINDIKRCVKQSIDKFSKIDVLINNAAIDAKFDKNNISKIDLNSFENYPIELIKKSIDVNMIGTIQMTQVACKQMLNQNCGNIINVASSYSLIAPNQQLYDYGEDDIRYKPVDYVASKSFLPNFTRYVATFYAKKNIRCNAIAPHGIYNNHDDKFLLNFSKFSPVGRMCDKSELRGPFLFLASDASSYITGTTLVIDGGWTAL